MKTVLIICILSFVGLSLSETSPHPRGCIYARGKCVRECEVGTHAYNIGCGYRQPEPTCDNPYPETETGAMICDYSACYCDSPTVRNKVTKECVAFEDCPE